MPAGDARHIDPDGALRIAADDRLGLLQHNRTAVTDEPEPARVEFRSDRALFLGVAAKGIAHTMRRSQITRLLRIVTQGRTDLRRQIVQIGINDVRAGPEPLPQRLLGDDAWTAGDEHRQQIEGLRGQMDLGLLPASQELTRARIEREVAEGHPQ